MTRSKFYSLFSFVFVFFFAFSSDTASCLAQSSSGISPWLTIPSNRRGDVLDPYNTYVRPQNDARAQMQGLSTSMLAEDSSMRKLENQMDRMLMQPTKGNGAGLGARGGAGYRQYLHYYQGLPQGGVPQYGKRR